MSVIIKGINMPNVCGACKIADVIECDGWKYIRSVKLDRWKHCPLVEVSTPHGDLIDKNIVLYEIYQYMYNRDYAVGHLYDVISYAVPVTVESEE